jgi:hypothetical protein
MSDTSSPPNQVRDETATSSPAEPLKLGKGVFRFLFISPANFVGTFERTTFGLTVIFPSTHRPMGNWPPDSAYSRSTVMLSFFVPGYDEESGLMPQFFHVSEQVSALMAAFYGKFVVDGGQIQTSARLAIPQMWEGPCHSFRHPAFNSKARKPGGPDLNLANFEKLLDVYFTTSWEDETLGRVLRAAEFYRMALENFQERPEMAYTLLVSSLEAIIDFSDCSDEERYDDKLRSYLEQIAAECINGNEIVANFKQRLFQVRRRVAKLVDKFIPDAFFQQREADQDFVTVKSREELHTRVLASYDYRSKLLHTGNRTGIGHLDRSVMGEEYVLGKPLLDDTGLVKILEKCLTLTGLERVTSAVLRSVIQEKLLPPPWYDPHR